MISEDGVCLISGVSALCPVRSNKTEVFKMWFGVYGEKGSGSGSLCLPLLELFLDLSRD